MILPPMKFHGIAKLALTYLSKVFEVVFCYKKSCVLLQVKLHFASRQVAFCFKSSCILLQDKLRFALSQVAFCFKTSCVLLQDKLRFALRQVAFCLKILVLVQGVVHRCLQQDDIHNGDHVQAVAATDDSLAIPEHMTVETPMNMSPKNKAHFQEEKEANHLILTRIGDEVYSTVDACQTAQEMWEAIKRFYKLMNEMIRNNLTVATMQVNVQFLQQLQPEWSRFVTIVKQQHKLDEVSYYKLFDILKQYQRDVNELRAERLPRNANPLALVATAQANQDPYYQTSKSHKSYAPSLKPSIPTQTHTTTRYKGKEIAKPITPPSKTAFEEDNDSEQA
nr:hypothetical protein [Tanacetum cinerariifolium]